MSKIRSFSVRGELECMMRMIICSCQEFNILHSAGANGHLHISRCSGRRMSARLEGKILHENAHDPGLKEKRGDLLIVRAMPVHSCEMGVSGECDVVEFHRVKEGDFTAWKRKDFYRVVPIEYKRGKPKEGEEDILQLAAQAFLSGRNAVL